MEPKKKTQHPEATGKNKEESVVISRVRINIRCRLCFMVDGYLPEERKCRHCGAELYRIDAV
ncbi:MAG: hypothetical protein NC911_01300 [Candidatus Omnitrophica bacterium]|nr:hypothetical protein [Candidatus Omnitrophota bacterium]